MVMNTPASHYLKETYGLDPGDLDLKATDTVADVKRMARKYGLKKTISLATAKAVMGTLGIIFKGHDNNRSH